MSMKSDRPVVIWLIAGVAVAFGLLSIKSGGSVLFLDDSFREAAGNYVPFVLWFNFIAGFVYIIAGVGLWLQKYWAVWISIFIVVATLIVFSILGMHIFQGGSYEVRTIGVMSLRTAVWTIITMFAWRNIARP